MEEKVSEATEIKSMMGGTGIHEAARAIAYAASAIQSASLSINNATAELAKFTDFLKNAGINSELIGALNKTLSSVGSVGELIKNVTNFVNMYGSYGLLGIQAGAGALIGKALLTALWNYQDNHYKNELLKHMDETLTKLLYISAESLELAISNNRSNAARNIREQAKFIGKGYNRFATERENVQLQISSQESLVFLENTNPINPTDLELMGKYIEVIIRETIKTFENTAIGKIRVESLPEYINTSPEQFKILLNAISNQTEMKFESNHDDIYYISYKLVRNLFKNIDGVAMAIKDNCKEIFNEVYYIVLSFPFNRKEYLEKLMCLIRQHIKYNLDIFDKMNEEENKIIDKVKEIYKVFKNELILTEKFSGYSNEIQNDMFYVIFMKAMLELCSENIAKYLNFPYHVFPQVWLGVSDTAINTFNIFRHPINTAGNILTAVIHPINTAQSMAAMAWHQPMRLGTSFLLNAGASTAAGFAINHIVNPTPVVVHQSIMANMGNEFSKMGVHSNSAIQTSSTISYISAQTVVQTTASGDSVCEGTEEKNEFSHENFTSKPSSTGKEKSISSLKEIIEIAEDIEKISMLLKDAKVYQKEDKKLVEIIFVDSVLAKNFQSTLFKITVNQQNDENMKTEIEEITNEENKHEFKLILSQTEFNMIVYDRNLFKLVLSDVDEVLSLQASTIEKTTCQSLTASQPNSFLNYVSGTVPLAGQNGIFAPLSILTSNSNFDQDQKESQQNEDSTQYRVF